MIKKIINPLISCFVFACFFCAFAISAAYALSPEEETRVNILIESLKEYSNIVFIRNKTEHTGEEAAAHLKRKLNSTKNRLSTAEQFIDKVASSSSISGEPYTIRREGQPEESANVFLHSLLKEKAPKP